MTPTGKSSLDAVLAEIERDDRVGRQLQSAFEHLRQARRELGMPEPEPSPTDVDEPAEPA